MSIYTEWPPWGEGDAVSDFLWCPARRLWAHEGSLSHRHMVHQHHTELDPARHSGQG